MSNINKKLNKISQLLSEHKFVIVNDITDDYKCAICNGIVNNAHQAICGCNFCEECINRFIENGGAKCPACQCENVLVITKNYLLNIRISKITVKCPNENCSYECKLIEMNEHLRLCSTRNVECPFSGIGCQLKEMSSEKLNDHFISNVEGHSKILIELIGQLRNEMKDLKENSMKKDEAIESLRNEIKAIKHENQELKTLIKNSNNNLWIKLNQIDVEMNGRSNNGTVKHINDKIESMRIAGSELEQQMKIVDRKCQELNGNVQIIHQVKAETDKLTKETERINKFLKMRNSGHLLWPIGKINEMKMIGSEMFYDFQNPYKIQLWLINATDNMNIQLLIYSGAFDEDLQWPVKAKLNIQITSLNDDQQSKSLTISCRIPKPAKNSYEESAEFSVARVDLDKWQMLDNNCSLVCSVKFK